MNFSAEDEGPRGQPPFAHHPKRSATRIQTALGELERHEREPCDIERRHIEQAEAVLAQKTMPLVDRLLVGGCLLLIAVAIVWMVLTPPTATELDGTVHPQPPSRSWETSRELDRAPALSGGGAPGGN